jgi:hypothetical protein
MANGKSGKAAAAPPPQSPPDGSDRRRPAHEVRLGRLKAAIWANDSEHGVRYSVSVARVYKDGQGRWQTSESFGRDDLLTLAKVLDRAHSWICEATQAQDGAA